MMPYFHMRVMEAALEIAKESPGNIGYEFGYSQHGELVMRIWRRMSDKPVYGKWFTVKEDRIVGEDDIGSELEARLAREHC